MIFFSLKELNQEIIRLLDGYNDLLFQRKESSRRELFQSIERSELKPLPTQVYELKEYRRAKVQKMGYVYASIDKNYYSVPYRFIGVQTQIHTSSNWVEVFHNTERIAVHSRIKSTGVYTTVESHLSSSHQAYKSWSPAYFKSMASRHGEAVMQVVDHILNQAKYPEIAYKKVMGIIQLHKLYGSDRLNNACQRALYGDALSYLRIKNILKNNMDKEQLDPQELKKTTSHIPAHENLRGPVTYN